MYYYYIVNIYSKKFWPGFIPMRKMVCVTLVFSMTTLSFRRVDVIAKRHVYKPYHF